MHTRLLNSSPAQVACDAVAVFAGEDWRSEIVELDSAFAGHLVPWLESQDFDGKPGAPLVTASLGRIAALQLFVVGVGARTATQCRSAAQRVAREARKHRVKHLAIHTGLGEQGIRSIVENVAFGNYEYDRYKAETDRKPALESLTLLGAEGAPSVLATCATRTRWQDWSRDLVNAPAADLYPASLAKAATEKLGGLEHVTVEVIDFETCKARGYVGIVAVGQASARPGCMIRVSYDPPGATEHIALVGKGVTFDSGGLSLKPSGGMQTMRCDMGGSAVVLGAMGSLAELGVKVKVDCFVGAVENMNGANSFKLGDILRYNNGVTVEIHNTDAEGRLVLADCLIEACATEGVTTVIDAATLTGACVVAIGGDFTGIFTDDDDLAAELHSAAKADGEGLWRLPLHAPYNEKLRGDWGQIKNLGGREAGATTAALFLKHFVTDDVQWAHLDVAGSSWRDRANGTAAAGATAEMVRSLTTWIARRA